MLLEQRASSRENWHWMGVFSPLLEKAMAPHSSTLAWKIPWTEEPGRLQAMRLLRVRHDWATSLWLFTFKHWRRKWQSTPVFLPRESQGRGEPGGLPSVGSHRVGHDWSDLAAAAAPHLCIFKLHINKSMVLLKAKLFMCFIYLTSKYLWLLRSTNNIQHKEWVYL